MRGNRRRKLKGRKRSSSKRSNINKTFSGLPKKGRLKIFKKKI